MFRLSARAPESRCRRDPAPLAVAGDHRQRLDTGLSSPFSVMVTSTRRSGSSRASRGRGRAGSASAAGGSCGARPAGSDSSGGEDGEDDTERGGIMVLLARWDSAGYVRDRRRLEWGDGNRAEGRRRAVGAASDSSQASSGMSCTARTRATSGSGRDDSGVVGTADVACTGTLRRRPGERGAGGGGRDALRRDRHGRDRRRRWCGRSRDDRRIRGPPLDGRSRLRRAAAPERQRRREHDQRGCHGGEAPAPHAGALAPRRGIGQRHARPPQRRGGVVVAHRRQRRQHGVDGGVEIGARLIVRSRLRTPGG